MARRDDDYGKILPTRRWRGSAPPSPRRWWQTWRWWLGSVLLVAAIWQVNRWWPDRAANRGTPQAASGTFVRCGKDRGPNCVVDGDTFIMGQRHIRIVGIDAPEIGAKARCPREAEMAEAAADELLRLLNLGPFTMQPPSDGLRDEYGRELMHVTRQRAEGTVEDIAAELVAAGRVRPFLHGQRQPWC